MQDRNEEIFSLDTTLYWNEIEKQEKAGLKFKEILNDVIEFEKGVILKEFQLVNSEGDLLYSSDFKKKYFQSHYYLCSLWFCMVSA